MTASIHIGLEQRHGHLKLFFAAGNKKEAWRMIALQLPLQLSAFPGQFSPRTEGARHLEFFIFQRKGFAHQHTQTQLSKTKDRKDCDTPVGPRL